MNPIKSILKKILSTKVFLTFLKGNRFIFVFHDVSDVNESHHSSHYSSTISRFKSQMELLKSQFEMIDLDEIVSNDSLDHRKNYASITFDDGFLSVLEVAHPILKSLGIPYSIFVNKCAIELNQNWISNLLLNESNNSYSTFLAKTAKVELKENEDSINAIMSRGKFSSEFKRGYPIKKDVTNIYLNEDQIKTLKNFGVLVGNHSSDHFVLSSTDSEELALQILDNQFILDQITQNKTNHFALPFGKKEHYNEKVLSEIKKAGYKYIYTTNPNRFQAEDLKNETFLFPRIGVTDETDAQVMFYINRTLLRKYDI